VCSGAENTSVGDVKMEEMQLTMEQRKQPEEVLREWQKLHFLNQFKEKN